jgi:hypothetical protein
LEEFNHRGHREKQRDSKNRNKLNHKEHGGHREIKYL